MEQLQQGYVLSVAATAGCLVEITQRDHHGVDVTFIRTSGAQQEETSLYAQLKCRTTKIPDLGKASFGYQFHKRDHFDHLTKKRDSIKAILLVMITYPDQSKWTYGNHETLEVRKCCYWVSLEGKSSTANNPTVQIPTNQIFSADALTGMLDRIDKDLPLELTEGGHCE